MLIEVHTEDRPISFTMDGASPADRLEPITLTWAKLHLRFPSSVEDTTLKTYLAAARTHFESEIGRQCLNAVWDYALDGVPCGDAITLPRPPLRSVVSITYDDADGIEHTVDPETYRVLPSFVIPTSEDVDPVIDPYCGCGRVELVSGMSWPTTSGLRGSLRIRRMCGYGATTDDIPPMILTILGLLAQHYFDRGLDALPSHVQALMNSFKYTALPTPPPMGYPSYAGSSPSSASSSWVNSSWVQF